MGHSESSDIDAVMRGYSSAVQPALTQLRDMVRDVADGLPEIGELVETLKWGQPSFLPKRARVGTTIRMDAISDDPPRIALYVHCQTSLVETFRELYPDVLTFEGNRAVVLDASSPLPEKELRHCIEMALIYHKAKRAASR